MTTKPFDFPKAWGKLGNWPGTINPQSALALLQEISKLPQGSSIVEFRFDGGRTSAVVGWGCKAGGHAGIVTGSPSPDGLSEVWFTRLLMLFELGGVLHREYAPKPYAATMLVVNPGYTISAEWLSALKPGGKVFYVGDARCETKEVAPGGDAKTKEPPPERPRIEAWPRLAGRVDGAVVPGVGGNGAGPDSQALAPDTGPVARDDGDGEGRGGPGEGGDEVVPEKGDV